MRHMSGKAANTRLISCGNSMACGGPMSRGPFLIMVHSSKTTYLKREPVASISAATMSGVQSLALQTSRLGFCLSHGLHLATPTLEYAGCRSSWHFAVRPIVRRAQDHTQSGTLMLPKRRAQRGWGAKRAPVRDHRCPPP